MVKIDSLGNEQIVNAMTESIIEKIKQSLVNKKTVFLAYENETVFGGSAVDALAMVGVGLENLFGEVQEKTGVKNANVMFDSFIRAISDVRAKNSRG